MSVSFIPCNWILSVARRAHAAHGTGTSSSGYLDDPGVVEIMLNPDGRLWYLLSRGNTRRDTPIPCPHSTGETHYSPW